MKTIVRFIIGAILWLIGRKSLPHRWLAHYLVGDGSPMYVPQDIIVDAEAITFAEAMGYRGAPFAPQEPLYWLVGTFTWNVHEVAGELYLVGVDRYDWHPNGGGEWDSAPTGVNGRWVKAVVRILSKTPLGEFVEGDYELYISDRLWPRLGGREFDTVVSVPLSALPGAMRVLEIHDEYAVVVADNGDVLKMVKF